MPNAFVVNIGEMWETWTNGLYKATLHRVLHKGDSYRVSWVPSFVWTIEERLMRDEDRIPFFFEPARDALVSPLPSALRLQELATGKPTDPSTLKSSIRYGDFLASKVSGNFALVDAA
jgi:isopenicillin N synthase-like dioxygenase